MIRFIAPLAGIVFVLALVIGFFMPREAVEETASHEFHREVKEVSFASDGPFGTFDRRQLQRGFQVYKEVCSACHGLDLVSFGDLQAIGYNEAEAKAIADQWAIQTPSVDPNTGEAATRTSIISDRFPSPFANEVAARAANNNALPPDLSLITKARHHGPAYVYSLLTGYRNPETYRNEKGKALPVDVRPGTGLYFNPWFPNLNIAMAPPITTAGQVTYADGTQATVDQMAKDVSAFLTWTAEPKLESRHSTGFAVVIFLGIFCVLAYLSYRNIWADRKHR